MARIVKMAAARATAKTMPRLDDAFTPARRRRNGANNVIIPLSPTPKLYKARPDADSPTDDPLVAQLPQARRFRKPRPDFRRKGRGDLLPSADRERRPDRHHGGEPEQVGVSQLHAAVGDASGHQLGSVRPVEPDEAAARPVREDGRSPVRAKRDRPVKRIVEAGQLVADVELAARR